VPKAARQPLKLSVLLLAAREGAWKFARIFHCLEMEDAAGRSSTSLSAMTTRLHCEARHSNPQS